MTRTVRALFVRVISILVALSVVIMWIGGRYGVEYIHYSSHKTSMTTDKEKDLSLVASDAAAAGDAPMDNDGDILSVAYETSNILQDVHPAYPIAVSAAGTLTIKAVARSGSSVYALIGNAMVTLTKTKLFWYDAQNDELYYQYKGVFRHTVSNRFIEEPGVVQFIACCDGYMEMKKGGNILLLPNVSESGTIFLSDDPAGGSMKEGMVSLVTQYNIPMFSKGDLSGIYRPSNTFLPEGTADFTAGKSLTAYDNLQAKTYQMLRSGQYVLASGAYNDPNVTIYKGSLPAYNTVTALSMENLGRHTRLTLDVRWKAPFSFLLPQDYSDALQNDYTVTEATATYIDIEFLYALAGQGRLNLGENPVFSAAQWIKKEQSYVLRLTLRRPGCFYGWNSYYDENGQLIFDFLNPAQIGSAEDLAGVKIVLDPGHGGPDKGAMRDDGDDQESDINLQIGLLLKSRLENLGADIVMTRSDDTELTLDERVKITKKEQPDLFISIHCNAGYKGASGYENYYFTPYSMPLAREICAEASTLYQFNRGYKYSDYYVTRITDCPAILTENGFISNDDEYPQLLNSDFQESLTDQITKGVIHYLETITLA